MRTKSRIEARENRANISITMTMAMAIEKNTRESNPIVAEPTKTIFGKKTSVKWPRILEKHCILRWNSSAPAI